LPESSSGEITSKVADLRLLEDDAELRVAQRIGERLERLLADALRLGDVGRLGLAGLPCRVHLPIPVGVGIGFPVGPPSTRVQTMIARMDMAELLPRGDP
jgi:hypothetical protein